MIGAVLGYCLKGLSSRFSDYIMAFAAGVMLSAAVIGLILPAADGGILVCQAGILAGAFFLQLLDRLLEKSISPQSSGGSRKMILFASAMAVHNLPEGLAAGVSLGTGHITEAMIISAGIALQNLPEGAVTVTTLVSSDISPNRALLCGVGTGVMEIIGTLLGYTAVTAAASILPFAMAFAGGTMLYVTVDDMIPQTHSGDSCGAVSWAFLAGFSVMMFSDILLERL